ncbi:hypothetical protein KY290_010327 [Solanum tuberosum]|uniref:Reverse transcriptase Ty1/copia-type domain-containing protein n=1 Tax=Solanum tuberosum TaxID=4113 RepID=A0ABQ7VZK1_SOLTU|nr:hypothetical protein KY290_010327 [Solanum tuberosum]
MFPTLLPTSSPNSTSFPSIFANSKFFTSPVHITHFGGPSKRSSSLILPTRDHISIRSTPTPSISQLPPPNRSLQTPLHQGNTSANSLPSTSSVTPIQLPVVSTLDPSSVAPLERDISSPAPSMQTLSPSNNLQLSPSQSPIINPQTHHMVTRSKTGSLKPRVLPSLTASTCSILSEPTSFSQACKDSRWMQAMSSEFDALVHNKTWTLVPPPPNANIVGNKWVFQIKFCANGSIERFKARLVAQGFSQHPGVD